MKQGMMVRLLALVVCILLAGCSAAPERQPGEYRSPLEQYPEEAVLMLVNEPSLREEQALPLSEYPSAQDETALSRVVSTGTADAVQPTSLFGSSTSVSSDEVRAVWISYLEMDSLLKNQSESGFRANISQVFDTVRSYGLNTVVVQVRPFGDALYRSDYFPWSYTITGTEGRDPGFDPLSVMVTEAKSRGLRFDAWINPYRVRAAGNTNTLSSDNQAAKWLEAGDGAVIRYNGSISYNPASAKARELIVNGVREIVRNYNVDAIHIDDYFYPSTDTAFDSTSYTAYQQSGGTMALADWRRNNVELLIRGIYDGVKAENPKVLFGISPQGNIDTNYHGQYLDVKKIVSTAGYCDYICPQVYYGFQNDAQPFARIVETWDSMCAPEVDLYIGIAVYKLGAQDSWAGSGRNEWLNTSTQLKEMVEASRALNSCTGFVLYRYDSLFRPASSVSSQVSREAASLKQILN